MSVCSDVMWDLVHRCEFDGELNDVIESASFLSDSTMHFLKTATYSRLSDHPGHCGNDHLPVRECHPRQPV